MATLWFLLVAVLLVAYVVLDGVARGAGAVYKLVARSRDERALVRRTIGPVWDANEVWLLAAGGTLYFAFPQLYASSFSGFYLPPMLVLWLLIGRALGLELRGHFHDALVGAICDTVAMISSLLLAAIRGVPLVADGYFCLPLWTNFRPGPNPGVLDWYTVLSGVVSLVALATHGSHYLALRTEGEVNARARRVGFLGTRLLPLLTFASLVATLIVRPSVVDNFRDHVATLLLPALVIASLVVMELAVRRGREQLAFLSSGAYLISMLGGAACALYPVLLPDSTDATRSLTIAAAATGSYAMRIALTWWLVALALVIGVFLYLYRTFRGKLAIGSGDDYH